MYLLDLKTCALKQLTFGMVKVDQVAIHPNGTEIAFSGIDYTDFADYRYGLYRYNLAEDKTRCVFEPGKYHIAQMVYLNDHKLMYTALKFHGIETRLCLYMGENHELSRSGHPKARVRRLAEITAWMEQHLKATR